jgi:GTPase involved in cell partitioning and DNA repair
MNGRRGLDTIITVPCGTTVQSLGLPTRALVPVAELLRARPTMLADLVRDGDEALVAGGGTGGRGNVALRSGRLQSSRLAEDGIPGEQASLLHSGWRGAFHIHNSQRVASLTLSFDCSSAPKLTTRCKPDAQL